MAQRGRFRDIHKLPGGRTTSPRGQPFCFAVATLVRALGQVGGIIHAPSRDLLDLWQVPCVRASAQDGMKDGGSVGWRRRRRRRELLREGLVAGARSGRPETCVGPSAVQNAWPVDAVNPVVSCTTERLPWPSRRASVQHPH